MAQTRKTGYRYLLLRSERDSDTEALVYTHATRKDAAGEVVTMPDRRDPSIRRTRYYQVSMGLSWPKPAPRNAVAEACEQVIANGYRPLSGASLIDTTDEEAHEPTLRECVDNYITHGWKSRKRRRNRGRRWSAKTIETYSVDLRHLTSHFGADSPWTVVDEDSYDEMDEYFRDRVTGLEDGDSVAREGHSHTRWGIWRTAKAMFEFCAYDPASKVRIGGNPLGHHILDIDPLEGRQLRLSIQDIVDWLSYEVSHDRAYAALVATFAIKGTRSTETCQYAKHKMEEMPRGLYFVSEARDHKGGTTTVYEPAPAQLLEMYDWLLGPFWRSSMKPLRNPATGEPWTKLDRMAGLKRMKAHFADHPRLCKAKYHDIRAALITHWVLDMRIPIELVSKMVRHSSVETTKLYVRDEQNVRDDMFLPPVENLTELEAMTPQERVSASFDTIWGSLRKVA